MKALRAVSVIMIAMGIALLGIGMASAGSPRGAARDYTGENAIDYGGIVRLHIIADDDSDAAQSVKLRVRDAIVSAYGARLRDLNDKEETLEFLRGELEKIELIASSVLHENGMTYGAHAELGEYDFPDREYDGMTVPAGRYAALKVTLGRGQGRNWWCVIYPALCVPLPCVDGQSAAQETRVEFYSAIWRWLSGAGV